MTRMQPSHDEVSARYAAMMRKMKKRPMTATGRPMDRPSVNITFRFSLRAPDERSGREVSEGFNPAGQCDQRLSYGVAPRQAGRQFRLG